MKDKSFVGPPRRCPVCGKRHKPGTSAYYVCLDRETMRGTAEKPVDPWDEMLEGTMPPHKPRCSCLECKADRLLARRGRKIHD